MKKVISSLFFILVIAMTVCLLSVTSCAENTIRNEVKSWNINDFPLYNSLINDFNTFRYALADVTHDGYPELIKLIDYDHPDNFVGHYDVFVYDKNGNMIYSEIIGVACDCEYDLYLAKKNDEYYFLQRNHGYKMDISWDYFNSYYLDPTGKVVFEEFNPGIETYFEDDDLVLAYDYGNTGADREEKTEYYKSLNSYLANSLLLCGVSEDIGTELLEP